MKCPICQAWTTIKETRHRFDGTTRRRYECANLHLFTTNERVLSDAEVSEMRAEGHKRAVAAAMAKKREKKIALQHLR